MKRKVMGLVLTALMASTMAFAGGQSDGGDDSINLTFASWSVQEKGVKPHFDQLKESFEADNPNISIEWVAYPYGQIKQQVLIMSSAGESPDIVQSERSWYNGFVSTGFVAPVDDLMGADYMNDIYPAIKDDLMVDGKTYGVPWFYSPFIMYYNKALFEEAGLDPNAPPTTYEEALTMAEKISQLSDADGNNVYGLGQTTASVPVSGGSVLSMLFSFGGGIWDAQGNIDVQTPENEAALAYLAELNANNMNPQGAKLKDLRNLFAIERLGMYFDTLWGIGGVKAINPAISDVVAVQLPLGTNSSTPGSTLEAHMLLISEDSENKEAAAKLVKYATSPEQMASYAGISTFLLPRASQVAYATDYASDPLVKPVIDAASTINSVEKNPNMENAYLELASASQMVTVGGSSPAEALAALQTKLETILK